jgi:hypothetical protein
MLRTVAEIIALAGTLVAAIVAVWTYRQRLKLERAKWMKDLYEKFYEHAELKKVRDLVDSRDSTEISNLVRDEPASFTDYLNFFEFLAYLHDSNQITRDEILGLFEYYLRSLRDQPDVSRYVDDPAKGFEKLGKLLAEVPR